MQSLGSSIAVRPFVGPAKQRRDIRMGANVSLNDNQIDRRAAVAVLIGPALLTARAAFAEGNNPRKERRAALEAAVKEIRETGEDKDAFPESNYTVGEDKSPNVHTRQEEGMRKS